MKRQRKCCVPRLVIPILGLLTATPLMAEPVPEKVAVRTAPMGGGSFLGVGVSEIDSVRAKDLKLAEERGVEITRVEEDGPAAKGGIKLGDVLLEYNGQRIEGTEQLLRFVRETPPGREVRIGLSRGGQTQILNVRTGSKKVWTAKMGEPLRVEVPNMEITGISIPDIPKAFMIWRSSGLGIEGESLEGQLADYFGVKEGVLVRAVTKGSPAEAAGLKAGDVITRVDGTSVSSPKEISNLLSAARERKTIALMVVRERREMSVNLTTGGE
jgi:serine protease Do